jgi:hypothetical protein
MAQKSIFIQTQGLTGPSISPVKPAGFVALNFDNLKMTIDAYDGFPCNGQPREDSKIEIIDEKEVFSMSPAQLIEAVRFFQKYATMGSDVARFKNVFHVVMPDQYKNAVECSKKGLEF